MKLLKQILKKGESLQVEVIVVNKGKMESDEAVQLYTKSESENVSMPLFTLKIIKRIHLKVGKPVKVEFSITPEMMNIVNNAGESIIGAGKTDFFIGGSLPSKRSMELGMSPVQHSSIHIINRSC